VFLVIGVKKIGRSSSTESPLSSVHRKFWEVGVAKTIAHSFRVKQKGHRGLLQKNAGATDGAEKRKAKRIFRSCKGGAWGTSFQTEKSFVWGVRSLRTSQGEKACPPLGYVKMGRKKK